MSNDESANRDLRIEDAMDEHRVREEFGITTAVPGTWMPEAAYRPVPVVWFGGALVLQALQLVVLLPLLGGASPFLTSAMTGMLSFAIGHWTFGRGMAEASRGWKIAVVVLLMVTWLLVAVAAFER